MNNKLFQLNKVRYAINTNGRLYNFKRFAKNLYGEKSTEESVIEIKGIFHTEKSYSKQVSGDATKSTVEYKSMILSLYEANLPKIDDEVNIESRTFKVTDVNNLYEENVIVDISLSEVLK